MVYSLEKVVINGDRPVREAVLESLRAAILSNLLKPGDKLIETAIAESLAVSRTPVREAFRQLEHEGLLVNTPRRGTYVRDISVEDAMNMYDIREVLEGLSVRLACNNISRKTINHMYTMLDDMSVCIESGDKSRLFMLNEEWKDIIVQNGGNRFLSKSMKDVYDHLQRLRQRSMWMVEAQRETVAEHRTILDCIDKGDVAGSESAARVHVKNARARFLSSLSAPLFLPAAKKRNER